MASARAQRVASIYTAGQLANAGITNAALLNQGYSDARGELNQQTFNGMQALDTGYDGARDQYGKASALYDPYASAGLAALGQYGNTIGLNGQQGYDQATASFRASPGYQYTVDQATDQVARKASATGALGSGNTLAAITDRAGNLADQEYQSYQNRLQGMSQMGLQATGAQAGLTKGIGDLDASQGTAKAGMFTGLGTSLAGLDTGLAQNLSNNNMAVATGQGQAVTSAGQASDAAKQANSNLLLGALGSIAGLGLGGGKTVGGTAITGLGSLGKSIFG
jgi:hypothetical protein